MDINGDVLFSYIVGGTLLNFTLIYVWSKLNGKKLNLKDFRLYVSLFFLVIFGTLLNFGAPKIFKMFVMMLLFFIVNYILITRKLNCCIISVLISQLMVMIAEAFFVIIVSMFFDERVFLFQDTVLGTLTINLAVILLTLFFMKTPLPYYIYDRMIRIFNDVRYNSLIFGTIVTLILSTVLTITCYTNLPIYIVLFINTIITIFYIIIVFKSASTHEKLIKISNKYKTSLTSLQEYEDMMDRTKVINHENKNQLLTIRNMVKAKDKGVVKYIEGLVDSKIKDNENIFYKTSKIPEGGLRAAIYSKLCKMEEDSINYKLNISNDVKAVDLIEMGDGIMLDVCNIVNVFLDNAIEEVKKLNNKNIGIDLFMMDGELCVEISNNYEGTIDLDKLDNIKYTTKGKGHGYGLTLVKQILKSNKLLTNERRINGKMFSQILRIKMQEKTVD